MKLKICLFTLFFFQSNFIDASDQAAEKLAVDSDLNFSSEPRSTQAELAEARKYKSRPVFTVGSLVSPKLPEIQTVTKKNITQAVVDETSSNQDQKSSTNLNAADGFDSSRYSEENPKSGVSQLIEAKKFKAKLPKTESEKLIEALKSLPKKL